MANAAGTFACAILTLPPGHGYSGRSLCPQSDRFRDRRQQSQCSKWWHNSTLGHPYQFFNNDEVIDVRTYSPKPGDVTKAWHVIDATDVVLGRLAVSAATLLRGKHKPIYAPHLDTGDFVIVVNADKVALTGNKRQTKLAYRHSGYPGGLSATSYADLLEKDPRRAIEKAVWGMLPKNRLSRQLLRKLKVYSGPHHPHAAQKPESFEIGQIPQ